MVIRPAPRCWRPLPRCPAIKNGRASMNKNQSSKQTARVDAVIDRFKLDAAKLREKAEKKERMAAMWERVKSIIVRTTESSVMAYASPSRSFFLLSIPTFRTCAPLSTTRKRNPPSSKKYCARSRSSNHCGFVIFHGSSARLRTSSERTCFSLQSSRIVLPEANASFAIAAAFS